MPTRMIEGQCHRGNIRYTLELPKRGERIPVRARSCGFYRAHGGMYTSDPEATLDVDIEYGSRPENIDSGREPQVFGFLGVAVFLW